MRSICVALTVVFTLGFCPILDAQDDLQSWSSGYEDWRAVFDRADRRETLAEWMQVASGALPAVPEWEQEAFEQQLRERLAAWLDRHLRLRLPEADLSAFFSERRDANLLYLYDTGETGAIRLDSAGDPLMKGTEAWEQDHEAWSAQLEARNSELIEQWETEGRIVYQEILGQVEAPYRDSAEARMSVSLQQYREAVAGEFERLFRQAENSFLRRRLQDSYSLRKKSEEQTAGELAVRLVEETEADLDRATNSLVSELKALNDTPAEEIEVALQNWEESFKQEFERGLERWNQAEKRFLQERIRWETEAGQQYLEAERSWDQAVELFGEARERWAEQIGKVIEEGRRSWEARESEFFTEYQTVVREMEEASDQEVAKLAKEVHACTSLYRQSAQVLETARLNIEFLEAEQNRIGQYRADKQRLIDAVDENLEEKELFFALVKHFYSLPFHSIGKEVLHRLKSELQELYATRQGLVEERDRKNAEYQLYQEELTYWRGVELDFRQTGLEAEQALLAMKERIDGYGSGVLGESKGAGGSYELELQRLEERVAMLGRQLDIARAVVEYAADHSSGRATEAQTKERYRAALSLFEGREAEYAEEIRRLEELSEWLAAAESLAAEQQGELQAAEQAFREARADFEEKWAYWTTNDAGIFQAIIEDLETEIDRYFLEERKVLHLSYFQAAESYRRQDRIEQAERMVRDLLGMEAEGEEDVLRNRGELLEAFQAVSAIELDWEGIPVETFRAGLVLAGIEQDDPWHRRLVEAYSRGFVAGASGALGRKEAQALQAELQGKYALELARCDELLALLEMESPSGEWESVEALAGLEMEEQEAQLEYLLGKVELESQVVGYLTGAVSAAQPQIEELASILALLHPERSDWSGELAVLEAIAESLEAIAEGADRLEVMESLEPVLQERLRSFVTGKDSFSVSDVNLADRYVLALKAQSEGARIRLEVWREYGSYAPVLGTVYRHERASRLAEILGFIDPEAYEDWGGEEVPGYSVPTVSLETVEEIVTLYERLYSAGDLPEYLVETLDRCLAARLWGQELDVPAVSEELEASIAAAEELLDGLDAGIDSLQKAALLYEHDFSGSRSLLLELISGYIERQEESRGSGPEARSMYLLEALEQAGLGPSAFSPQDIKAFRNGMDDPEISSPYSAFFERELSGFISEHYDPQDLYEKVRLAARLQGIEPEALRFSSALTALFFEEATRELVDSLISATSRALALEKVAALDGLEVERQELALEEIAFQELLNEAIRVYEQEQWIPDTDYEQFYQVRQDLYGRVTEIKDLVATLELKQRQLAAWETSQQEYYESEVVLAEERMNELKDVMAGERSEYRRLLDEFSALSERYLQGRKAVEAAFQLYQEARYGLQEATEIRDYALSGYDLQRLDPQDLYQRRLEEYNRNLEILNILRRIDAAKASPEALDSQYLSLKEEEKTLTDDTTYLVNARQALEVKIRKTDEKMGRSFSVIQDKVIDSFSFQRAAGGGVEQTLAFCPDLQAGSERLTDFSSLANEQIDAELERYFAAEQSEEVYSTDIVLWMSRLSELGAEGLLRRFGLAYFYESFELGTKKDITIYIYQDQNYRKLMDEYVREQVPNPNGIWPPLISVRVDMDQYLKDYCRSFHSNIASNAELNKLYSFFKVMMKAGMVDSTTFIGKDLSAIARAYVNAKAKSVEKRKKRRWLKDLFTRESKKIKRLRHNMTTINGKGDRKETAGLASSLHRESASYRENKELLSLLLGSDSSEVSTVDALKRAMEQETDIEVSDHLELFLAQSFGQLSAADLVSSLKAIDGLIDIAAGALQSKSVEIRQRVAQLRRQRQEALAGYMAEVADQDPDLAAVESLARALYEHPAYTDEGYYAAQLDYAGRIESYGNMACRALVLDRLGEELVGYFGSRLELANQAQYNRLQQSYEELIRRRNRWEQRTAELFRTGAGEWARGLVVLTGQRKRWQEEYAEAYGQQAARWQDQYALLLSGRERWVQDSAQKGARAGSVALAREVGLDAERMIAEVEEITIPDLRVKHTDLSGLVEEVVDGRSLEAMVAHARFLTAQSERGGTVVAAFLPELRNHTAVLLDMDEVQEQLCGEIRKHVALAGALQMRKAVDETEEGIAESVEKANRSVERGVDTQLIAVGYRRQGHLYTRRAIIDMTLLQGIEEETHRIRAYRYFIAPAFDVGVDLSRRGLEGLPGEVIQAKVESAVENLQSYVALIFGEEEEKGLREGLDEWFISYLERQEALFAASARYGEKGEDGEYLFRETRGLFNFHVGYAPKMKEDDPEEVEKAGYGEMGRIYELFLRNEARLGRGLAALDVAWYSQKLWDDDADNDGESDRLFGAPSVRSVVDLATSVIATACLGPGGALLLNLADDALFTMADVSGGVMSWDEGLVGFTKKGLSSAVGTGIGQAGGYLSGQIGAAYEGAGGVIGQTMVKGAELGLSNMATGALEAIQYQHGGLWGYDIDAFRSSLVGAEALAGYAAGMTGTFVSSGLGTVNLSDVAGFSSYHTGQIGSFNTLIGGIASSAVEYAMLGETTLNVVNMQDIGNLLGFEYTDYQGNAATHGLLELHLEGEGPLFGLGQDGTNLSASAIVDSIGGMVVMSENRKIKRYSREYAQIHDGQMTDIMLRAAYSFGDEQGLATYRNILRGADRLHVGIDVLGEAETVTRTDGGRDIYLQSFGNDLGNQLVAAALLQHEAHRDGYIPGDIRSDGTLVSLLENELETRQAVTAEIEMAIRIASDYGQGFVAENNDLLKKYVAYKLAEELGQPSIWSYYIDSSFRSDRDFAKRVGSKNWEKMGLVGVIPTLDSGRLEDFYENVIMGGPHALFRLAGLEDREDVVLTGERHTVEQDQLDALLFGSSMAASAYLSWVDEGAITIQGLISHMYGISSPEQILSKPGVVASIVAGINSVQTGYGYARGIHDYFLKDLLVDPEKAYEHWHYKWGRDKKIFGMAEAIDIGLNVAYDPQTMPEWQAEIIEQQMVERYLFLGNKMFNDRISKPDQMKILFYGGYTYGPMAGVGQDLEHPGVTLSQYQLVPGYLFKEYRKLHFEGDRSALESDEYMLYHRNFEIANFLRQHEQLCDGTGLSAFQIGPHHKERMEYYWKRYREEKSLYEDYATYWSWQFDSLLVQQGY